MKKQIQSNNTGNINKKNRAVQRKKHSNEKTLKTLFEGGINNAYNIEQQLIHALPEISNAVQSEELRHAIEGHLEQTKKTC
jgi:hypothetical protein